eukprot:1976166-Pyramimonas_sp.AAC.1
MGCSCVVWPPRRPSWGHLEAGLRLSRGPVRPSWGPLAPSWGSFGPSLGPLEPYWGPSWCLLGHLGATLEAV